MHPKSITSPETVVPAIVTVVALLVVVCCLSAGVVRSLAQHDQPFGADNPVAPPKVITAVQVPLVPDVYVPAVAPPVVADIEQPEVVNFVPTDT